MLTSEEPPVAHPASAEASPEELRAHRTPVPEAPHTPEPPSSTSRTPPPRSPPAPPRSASRSRAWSTAESPEDRRTPDAASSACTLLLPSCGEHHPTTAASFPGRPAAGEEGVDPVPCAKYTPAPNRPRPNPPATVERPAPSPPSPPPPATPPPTPRPPGSPATASPG